NWRLESDFLTNFDDKCDFGASSNTKIAAGAEISVLEERPSDEFLQPKCRKYPIFYQNSTIKNAGEGEISKNFTSSINKLILITFSTLGEKSINFPVIEFKVIENTVIFRAWALYDPNSNSTSNSIGVITSPWYPKSYPQNIVVNYTFINENPIGGVQLLFSDYQLHYMSSIKIFDSDGTVIHGATSANDYSVTRPCSVSSSGPKLTLLFSSGPYATDIGFRAEYKFTLRAHWPNNPVCKTCDKIYDQKAGVIILDPSLINTPNIYIDCIWLVSKSRFSSPLYDQIYLKIRDLSILKHSHKNLSFEIRQGLTSQSPLLFHYGTSSLINNYDDSDYSIQFPIVNDSFVLNLPDGRTTGYEKCGFYIRLKGFYLGGIGVALIFTQFYKWANA
uniref:CUB domain-containing protein n=1 Tax=Romanomermis culicivorax TaxID=13658 RepID=A0A915L9G1_ROMCU